MKQSPTTLASFAGFGLLTSALLAQTPPSETPPPRQPPERQPQQPQQPSAKPQQPAQGAAVGYMQTPPYAQRLDSTLSENGIQICADNDFKGEQAMVEGLARSHKVGTLNPLPANFDNAITSLRWNLAPGMLVVLFEDDTGKGQQLALWGKGQIPDLGKVDFNETASRWAWYDVGGGKEAPSAGNVAVPHGAHPLDGTTPVAGLHVFDDQNYLGEQQKVGGITGMKAGDWHTFPDGKENSASSLRWKLPEGAIVILAAEDTGNDTIVLFGEAQNPDLGVCDFDNRASRWTWAYIGAGPDADGKGMTPREP